MADSEPKDCPCTNISIMQLFHELKQRYPKIPDQVVSKVIEQNSHDKSACETILQRESHYYLQSYPGALISGNARYQNEPLCRICSASRTPGRCTSSSHNVLPVCQVKELDSGGRAFECRDLYSKKVYYSAKETVSNRKDALIKLQDSAREGNKDPQDSDQMADSSSSLETDLEIRFTAKQKDSTESSTQCSAVIEDRISEDGCEKQRESFPRSQSCVESPSRTMGGRMEIETRRWSVHDGGRKSAIVSGIISHSESCGQSQIPHNYQVAVECCMRPISPDPKFYGERARSFTSVNLSLRPPSSEPQPPIEIQSGQGLTYTTSSFDPKKGYQSQLQIRIDPGGSGTFSSCRTYISTPQYSFSSNSPNVSYHLSGNQESLNRHHLRALLEKQKERKDLLDRELRREKDKLRSMQIEVRLMKAAIAQRPSPHILPKLKAEILRLRTECEKLTAAVDLYSDSHRNLPLGETNEEFYRNIYTGQRMQREGSWSCQLCTFRNHPLLSFCEECEMPRLLLGTSGSVKDVTSSVPNVFSNNNNPSFCPGAGTSTSASLITAPLQER